MTITLNGTTGITTPAVTNDGAYTGDGVVFADGTPSNTLVTTTGGNVGIGTSSPAGAAGRNLTIYNSSGQSRAAFKNSVTGDGANDGFQVGIDGDGEALLDQRENLTMRFATNAIERMRITSGGDVSLGGTPAAPPTVNNDIFAGGLYLNPNRRTTGSGANTFFDSSSGAIFRSTSSIKYKIDVNDATYGLLDVLKLRPVTYKGKSDTDGNKVFGGFIAEEIDALGLKEFVEYDSEGNPDSLAYGNMVSLLTKAIQELKAELDTVKTELATLKGTV